MLELDWTNSGKAAVSRRDCSYFSPTFMMDESGGPSGLPSAGAIGSLVNNPAFRLIKRLAASRS
jgi:phage I-like protein